MMTATPGLDLPTAGSFFPVGVYSRGTRRSASGRAVGELHRTLVMICGRFWTQAPLVMLGARLFDAAFRRLLLLSVDVMLFFVLFSIINFWALVLFLLSAPCCFSPPQRSRLRSLIQA